MLYIEKKIKSERYNQDTDLYTHSSRYEIRVAHMIQNYRFRYGIPCMFSEE